MEFIAWVISAAARMLITQPEAKHRVAGRHRALAS